jgi:hypothetical protein
MFVFRLRNRRFRPLILRCAVPVLAGLLAVPAAAEVPVGKAYELHLQTLPARRELSPFWGMAALKTDVLANVRFFGAYADVANPAFPAHPSLKTRYDHPQDAISGLVQYLFPSPDGRNLVLNERDNDPIGLIAREQRRPPAPTGGNPVTNPPGNATTGPITEDKRELPAPVTGLRKLMALLDAADAYREKLRSPSQATEAGAAFQDRVRGILAPAEGVRLHGQRKRTYEKLRQDVANLMQQALLQEVQDKEDRYPPRIVETALLAYAWLVADSPAELQAALPGLFLPKGALPAHHQAGPPAVETKAAIVQPDAVETRPGATPGADPAKAFFDLLKVIQKYELTPAFISMGNAVWAGNTFPDCGETSLRNFFLAMLWTKGDSMDPKLITDLETRLTPEVKDVALGPAQVRFGQLIQFFKDHPGLAAQGTQECRDKWAAIVSGVNVGANDPLPVPYRDAGSCNIAGNGIEAMLNLVAHLLPDPILNAPWPEPGPAWSGAIAGKLDRLCALFPRGEARLSWETGAGKRIAEPYVTLTFTNGDNKLFSWTLRKSHYEIAASHQAQRNDPLFVTAAFGTTDYWVKAISMPRVPESYYGADRFSHPNDRYYFRHRGDEADRTIRAMLLSHGPMDVRVISLLVYRGLPLNIDLYDVLASLYTGGRNHPPVPVIPGLRDLPQEDRDRLLADSMSRGSKDTTRMLIDHGASVEARDGLGRPLVHLAIMGGAGWSRSKLDLLAAAGADFQARDAGGRTALHVAVEYGHVEAVALLLGKGLDVHARDSLGKTPLDVARETASPHLDRLPPNIRNYMDLLENAPRDSEGKTTLDVAQVTASRDFQHLPLDVRIYLDLLKNAPKVEKKTETPVLANPGSAPTELPGH